MGLVLWIASCQSTSTPTLARVLEERGTPFLSCERWSLADRVLRLEGVTRGPPSDPAWLHGRAILYLEEMSAARHEAIAQEMWAAETGAGLASPVATGRAAFPPLTLEFAGRATLIHVDAAGRVVARRPAPFSRWIWTKGP